MMSLGRCTLLKHIESQYKCVSQAHPLAADSNRNKPAKQANDLHWFPKRNEKECSGSYLTSPPASKTPAFTFHKHY